MNPIVRLRNLHKSYGDLQVLRGVNLDIADGETVSIIGASGSGKSTLLRLMMTLERPDDGTIEINGEYLWHMRQGNRLMPATQKHLRQVRGAVGMVFQHFNLFPHMTVLRNVFEAPVHVLGLPRREAEDRAREHLAMVGLEDKLDAYPAQLSGGQRQRVAIARALAMRPKVVLFDEITSALDPELVGGILRLLRSLSQRRSITMVIVTHHMKFAADCADRVVFFDSGVILEEGKPSDIFTSPKNERTRQFLESVLEAS
jgi:polar amino acid transport system ATP-binding protein